MMDNLEDVVVNFQRTLLVILEKVEKLESMEKSSRDDIVPNGKEQDTKEIKQLTNDTTLTDTPHQQPVSIVVGKNGISRRSLFAGTFGNIIKKVSLKPSYYILAIALAILGVIIVKLCLMVLH